MNLSQTLHLGLSKQQSNPQIIKLLPHTNQRKAKIPDNLGATIM